MEDVQAKRRRLPELKRAPSFLSETPKGADGQASLSLGSKMSNVSRRLSATLVGAGSSLSGTGGGGPPKDALTSTPAPRRASLSNDFSLRAVDIEKGELDHLNNSLKQLGSPRNLRDETHEEMAPASSQDEFESMFPSRSMPEKASTDTVGAVQGKPKEDATHSFNGPKQAPLTILTQDEDEDEVQDEVQDEFRDGGDIYDRLGAPGSRDVAQDESSSPDKDPRLQSAKLSLARTKSSLAKVLSPKNLTRRTQQLTEQLTGGQTEVVPSTSDTFELQKPNDADIQAIREKIMVTHPKRKSVKILCFDAEVLFCSIFWVVWFSVVIVLVYLKTTLDPEGF